MSNVISIFGNRDPREVPLYTVGQAAAYLHVPVSTVRAWCVGAAYPRAHGRAGRFRPLLALPKSSPARLTFNNLIEAYVLSVMRKLHHVPLGAIRRALANVTEQTGIERPLLSIAFETDGSRLYWDELGKLIEASTGKGRQLAMRAVMKGLKRIERDERGVAVGLFPFVHDVDEPRVVSIDPRRSFGRPTLQGTGVTVDIVADLVRAGEPPEAVAREFGVSKDAVNRAVSWQRHLAA